MVIIRSLVLDGTIAKMIIYDDGIIDHPYYIEIDLNTEKVIRYEGLEPYYKHESYIHEAMKVILRFYEKSGRTSLPTHLENMWY